jgi:hypothetical protein
MPKSKKRGKRHNTSFARQEQRYSRNVKENVSWIYSGLAVVLHKRYGFGSKRIMDVLTDLQNLFVEKDIKEIVRQAYKDTGLLLMSEQTAMELGIDLESEVKI